MGRKLSHNTHVKNMYDNIQLIIYMSENQLLRDKFSMKNENLSKGTYNNAGYENLVQNGGLYIKYEPSPSHYIVSFSLHKYYCLRNGIGLENYTHFSCSDVKNAYQMSILEYPFLQDAKIVRYEVGINVEMSANPSDYMRELDYIAYGKRKIRIIESPKHKEYKVFQSHSSNTIRSTYIFYDKMEESKNSNCPINLLRCEKKYTRLSEKVYYNDGNEGLFSELYMQSLVSDLHSSFVRNLYFHQKVVKSGSKNDYLMQKMLVEFGENAQGELQKMYKNGEITKTDYYRQRKKMKEIGEKKEKIVTKNRPYALEMREKIEKKIKML